jgi:sugar/nucleoside kinase (ribokinase family)
MSSFLKTLSAFWKPSSRSESSVTMSGANLPATGLFVGLSTFDAIFEVSALPGEDEKIFANAFRSFAGGPALNAAVTFAVMGGHAALCSLFGTDPFSAAAATEVESFGVRRVGAATSASFRFPVATVLISGGGSARSVISASRPSPTDRVSVADLRQAIVPSMPSFVLTDGHYMGPDSGEWLGTQSQLPLLVDAGSWKESFRQTFCPSATVIAGKAFEAEGGISPFEYAKQKGVRRFARTAGEQPIVGYDEAGDFSILPPTAKAVDTLGAGDVFHGAFGYYHFGRSLPFRQALAEAATVAAAKVQYAGPREGVIRASRAEV